MINGYGELTPIRSVNIAAEVKGRIVYIHPQLTVGGIIEAGETLFKIDNNDYLTEFATGKERQKILTRDYQLAENEFNRIKKLFLNSKVGTLAMVEKEEQRLNSIADRLVQVERSLRIAELNLKRCTVSTNFRARITRKNVEEGQFVAPGQTLVSLADDSVLELTVPVDSQDVLHWLSFANNSDTASQSLWFKPPQPVVCQVSWTENPQHSYPAILDRISQFNAKTRTVDLVARITPQAANTQANPFPLTAGMFCKIEIPGKILNNVFSLPQWAVSYDNRVYVAKKNRLATSKVKVAKSQNNQAYISDGIQAGDVVITTRLVDPLEGILLNITLSDTEVTP
jgi:RND family efflux transporter MFP subunit